MARYKVIETNPPFLSVDLARQLLPGTLEHALNRRRDHEVDLAHFDARFRNDTTGGIRAASPEELTARILQHLTALNQDPVVFTWTYRLDDIALMDSKLTLEANN